MGTGVGTIKHIFSKKILAQKNAKLLVTERKAIFPVFLMPKGRHQKYRKNGLDWSQNPLKTKTWVQFVDKSVWKEIVEPQGC